MSENHKDMHPVSGEHVEVDGVYKNEWGREIVLKRGDEFPADLVLGKTEWRLIEYGFDNHHDGETDTRLYPKKEGEDKKGFIATPKQFVEGTDHYKFQ